MSAAFDTINRRHLLDIIKSIVDEDKHRLIQFLLSGTVIDTRINGTSTSKPFTSNVGTPQGDSLSPVLLTILYLEHALKEVRPMLPRPTSSFEAEIPNDVAYADIVDFNDKTVQILRRSKKLFKKKQRKVNSDKTEYYTSISKSGEGWKEVKKKKDGSLIDDDKGIERRKQLATVALYKLNNVWVKGNKLKISTKIKLYKSLVQSILLYNCGAWALILTDEERLNAYHRKQLKKILNIRYPKKIRNKSLYRIYQEKLQLLQILSVRWSLFGQYSAKRQRHSCK